MIELINNKIECDKYGWCELIHSSLLSNYFQTPECYVFFNSLSFMDAFVFGVVENDILKGVVVGYITKEKNPIKQFFTRRAIITGGPLLANDISDEALLKLLTYTKKQLSNKSIYIEIRNFNDYSKYKYVFKKVGFNYQEHLNFHIDTSTIEIVQSNLGKSRKRDIKTSIRDGAVIELNPTINQILDYYNILVDLYKTKVKTPLFPFEYFEKLYKLDSSLFCLVKLNEEIIGGTVCVRLSNMALYELFACGKDGVYKNIFPSTLATYSAIEYAANNGIKLFDMMGAGKPNEGYGVRDFKAKFGGELVEHGRFLCVNNLLIYRLGVLGVKILKKK